VIPSTAFKAESHHDEERSRENRQSGQNASFRVMSGLAVTLPELILILAHDEMRDRFHAHHLHVIRFVGCEWADHKVAVLFHSSSESQHFLWTYWSIAVICDRPGCDSEHPMCSRGPNPECRGTWTEGGATVHSEALVNQLWVSLALGRFACNRESDEHRKKRQSSHVSPS